MTKSAFSRESGYDDYHIMRHLFSEARRSCTTDKRWQIHSTFSDPGVTMLTAYYHVYEGDVIKCQSFDYDVASGKYNRHIFTFEQDVDSCESDPSNVTDHRAQSAPVHHLVGRIDLKIPCCVANAHGAMCGCVDRRPE
jgi:hypothetical protein